MSKFSMIFVAAVAIVASASVAEAGCGCGGGGWGGSATGSLINVSPSIDLGKVTALNDILGSNNLLSGNVISGILDGNKTNIVGGVLSGIGVNVLGGNSYKLGKRH